MNANDFNRLVYGDLNRTVPETDAERLKREIAALEELAARLGSVQPSVEPT